MKPLIKPLHHRFGADGNDSRNLRSERLPICGSSILAVAALDDTYPELADFVADRILPGYGRASCR